MRIFLESGDEQVYLDLTHLDADHIRNGFPRIFETCLRYGIDITAQPVPVHPAAHYAMGGVKTDLGGRTSLARLYAAGETACTGVHGANRLASNSLLEGVVFGARAGRAMRNERGAVRPSTGIEACCPEIDETALRGLTWEKCGIVRTGEGLNQALKCLEKDGPVRRCSSVADYELRNLHAVAALMAKCAIAREESRGAHYRADFPEKKPDYQKHSILSLNQPVRFEK